MWRKHHVKFYTYLGIFDTQFNVEINSEHLDYEWFDIHHLPENMHPGVQEMFENIKSEIIGIIEKLIYCSL